LCHNLETKSTSALLWSIGDYGSIDRIISNIMTDTGDRCHPFHLLHGILLAIHLNNLSSVAQDLNRALEDRLVSGFEYYFLRAGQKYFRAKTFYNITPLFSEAEALCGIIIDDDSFPTLNGTTDREAETQLWMPYPKAKASLLRKRAQNLKTMVKTDEETVAAKFSIVSVTVEVLARPVE
jgi:hypothetical protein